MKKDDLYLTISEYLSRHKFYYNTLSLSDMPYFDNGVIVNIYGVNAKQHTLAEDLIDDLEDEIEGVFTLFPRVFAHYNLETYFSMHPSQSNTLLKLKSSSKSIHIDSCYSNNSDQSCDCTPKLTTEDTNQDYTLAA